MFCKKSLTFSHRHSFLLQRTPDDHRNCITFQSSINLILKSPCFSCILCDQISAVILSEHCSIQLSGKRPLHSYQMFSLKSQLCTGFHHIGQRKDSCIKTVLIILHACETGQFLASCCHQNLSLCARQIRYRFFCRIDHDAGWICRKRRPQQPKIRFSCFFTCRPDIFRHKIGIRMGCIDNHFRLFFAKKLFHLFFCQSSASNRQGTALLDPALAVFCRRTGKGCNLIFLQKTADFPAFRRSGKDDYFIHSDIPSALPCDPGFPLSDCFR